MGKLNDPADTLTSRQREVLELVARGRTNFEVAQELGITLDGAKWHLREIMAKLGCDTREEAVAIWLGRPSAPRRIASRMARPFGIFTGGMARAAGATVAVGIAIGAVILVTLARGEEASRTGQPSGADAPVVATATPDDNGQSSQIAFRSCGTSTFRRPTIAEMAQPFTNPRFAGRTGELSVTTSERPGPPYFSYYLTNVYEVVPRAISANIESTALSGIQQNGAAQVLIPAADPCDAAFRQDYTLNFYEFWFIDMLPTAARLEGVVLTFEVDVLPRSMTDIVLPDPPVPAPVTQTKNGFNGLPPFKELRVVEPRGELLYTKGAGGTAQYEQDGSLVFASNAFGGSEIVFEVRGRAQTIVIYTHESVATGAVTLWDATGTAWTSGPREQAPNTWAEVFRGTLPVGAYRVDAGLALIVPAGTPLP